MQAIETRYKGYRFRSRLEARWAVFFDVLGVPFEYEKEGYSLPSGRYLTDFWMPSLSVWIEIKGDDPTNLEERLASELAIATSAPVFIFSGQVPGYEPDWSTFFNAEKVQMFSSGGWDNFYAFCICGTCGSVGLEFEGRSDRMRCKDKCARSRHGDKSCNIEHPRVLNAIAAARSARFEFGESGAA